MPLLAPVDHRPQWPSAHGANVFGGVAEVPRLDHQVASILGIQSPEVLVRVDLGQGRPAAPHASHPLALGR
eukprot:6780771-Pyramimonas_sp.AAC.1